MCAFANDFHNLGGGYIIIGIREKNGRPVLPPKGLKNNQVDKIQKEVIKLGYKIQPYYHPIVIPCTYKRKNILVLWAVGGQTCPYKVPVSLSKTNKHYAYYIRKTSKTVIARAQDEKELFELAATVPLDDVIKVIRPDKTGQFNTKVLIELEHPSEKILVYSPSIEPKMDKKYLESD